MPMFCNYKTVECSERDKALHVSLNFRILRLNYTGLY